MSSRTYLKRLKSNPYPVVMGWDLQGTVDNDRPELERAVQALTEALPVHIAPVPASEKSARAASVGDD